MRAIAPRLLRAVLALVVLVILIALGIGGRDCDRRGGHYVRGLFWMECIQ